jgi:hypothetical protein
MSAEQSKAHLAIQAIAEATRLPYWQAAIVYQNLIEQGVK